MAFRDPQTRDQIHQKLAVAKSMNDLALVYKSHKKTQWHLDQGIYEWIIRSWTGFTDSTDQMCTLAFAIGAGHF